MWIGVQWNDYFSIRCNAAVIFLRNTLSFQYIYLDCSDKPLHFFVVTSLTLYHRMSSNIKYAESQLHRTRSSLLKKRKTLQRKKQRMEERKVILDEEIKILKETGEKMKTRFGGETLELLLSRHLGEISKKQKQVEKIKEDFKLLLIDFNINGNEIQTIDDEITRIESFDIDFMEMP